jgi:hypothetical protein
VQKIKAHGFVNGVILDWRCGILSRVPPVLAPAVKLVVTRVSAGVGGGHARVLIQLSHPVDASGVVSDRTDGGVRVCV